MDLGFALAELFVLRKKARRLEEEICREIRAGATTGDPLVDLVISVFGSDEEKLRFYKKIEIRSRKVVRDFVLIEKEYIVGSMSCGDLNSMPATTKKFYELGFIYTPELIPNLKQKILSFSTGGIYLVCRENITLRMQENLPICTDENTRIYIGMAEIKQAGHEDLVKRLSRALK